MKFWKNHRPSRFEGALRFRSLLKWRGGIFLQVKRRGGARGRIAAHVSSWDDVKIEAEVAIYEANAFVSSKAEDQKEGEREAQKSNTLHGFECGWRKMRWATTFEVCGGLAESEQHRDKNVFTLCHQGGRLIAMIVEFEDVVDQNFPCLFKAFQCVFLTSISGNGHFTILLSAMSQAT